MTQKLRMVVGVLVAAFVVLLFVSVFVQHNGLDFGPSLNSDQTMGTQEPTVPSGSQPTVPSQEPTEPTETIPVIPADDAFVKVSDWIPNIVQDIRYSTTNNKHIAVFIIA